MFAVEVAYFTAK